MIVSLFTGGLWLGGNVYLTRESLIFELNSVNKFLHGGNARTEIPLTDIRQVKVMPSFGFKTIQLINSNGEFKIKVKGASEYAKLIEESIAKAKS